MPRRAESARAVGTVNFAVFIGRILRYSVGARSGAGVAAGGTGGLVYILHTELSVALGAGFLDRVAALGARMIAGMAVCFGLAALLRIEEARLVVRRVLR